MEVVALIEVLDEPGMCRLPAQQLAGQRARDRVVGREEAGQEAEVLARLARRDGDHRDVEVSPDHLGDGADRHILVRDRVQPRSRRCLLQGQAEQVCRIEPVHGGPAAGAVADEARDSLGPAAPVTKTRMSNLHRCRSPLPQRMPRLHNFCPLPQRPGGVVWPEAGRALRHHEAACLRPGPGQTGNVTPVSSSETVHRRRWRAVSWDCPLEWASFG